MRNNININAALEEVREKYISSNPESRVKNAEAKQVMPGGNTRTALYYSPFPVTIAGGEGAHIWDVDGHSYADFLVEFTAGLYGHSDPIIANAVHAALDKGLVLGGPNLIEAELARLMCDRFPAVERLRFCNSGTESNIFALSAARAFTGRTDILVVEGSYHGGPLSFEGESPLTLPFPIHKMTYNDPQGAVEKIRALGNKLAVVLVEPVIGAGGGIPASSDFLLSLRSATEETGALLIFDEVMTSRLSSGGMHGYHGIKPDVVTFGKYLGGGLTFGAFGGRADIIDKFDPSKPGGWAHAGTFNNNILTMAAGHAGLSKVYTPDVANEFFERGTSYMKSMQKAVSDLDLPIQITGMGSMMVFHVTDKVPSAPLDSSQKPNDLFELLHLDMMERGQYYARRGMINLSLPMTQVDLDNFQAAFIDVLETRAPIIRSVFSKIQGG